MTGEFEKLRRELETAYGGVLDELDVPRAVLGDFIEIAEDFERLHPLVTSIMTRKASLEEFQAALLKLEAWSWHLSDHLSELHKSLAGNSQEVVDED